MPKITPWLLKPLSLFVLLVLFLGWPSSGYSRCTAAENYYHFLVAEYLLGQGQLSQAKQHLEKVVRCDPKAIFPKKELMKVYAETGAYDKAIKLAREILALSPDDKETLFILAKLYWMQKRLARAVETLETLLEKYPDYEEALSVLAAIYLQKNDVDGAIAALERLAKKENKNPALYLELARLYRKKGAFDRARFYYEEALKLFPERQEVYLEYGEFLEKIGAVTEAEKVYRKGLEKLPQPFHLYEALLRLYLRQHQYEKALAILQEIEKQAGISTQLLLRKALILLDLGRTKEAVKILKDLVEKDPQNFTAWFYLGVAYEKEGKRAEAINAYERIPVGDELFPLALRRLAHLLKDPDTLAQLFERALAEREDDKNLYLLAATVFDELDACAQGLKFVKEGLKKFPEDLDLSLSAGLLLVCEGKEKEALKLLEPLLKKYPDNPTLLNFVGYTYADLNMNLTQAEQYIRKALSEKPDDGYIVDSLAWVYYRQGKYEEALVQIQRALKLTPDDPIIHEHHGDILLALGRKKEALSAYRKALSLARKEKDRKRLQEKIEKLCAQISCSP